MVIPGQGPLAPHYDAPASSGRLRNRRSNRDPEARDTACASAFVRNPPTRSRGGYPRDSSFVRNNDKLPANNRLRCGSRIRFILVAARWCLFLGDSPIVALILLLSRSLMARSPASRNG